jgi:hypothetical protein
LQPFDVAVASPLKNMMAKKRDRALFHITVLESKAIKTSIEEPEFLAKKRQKLIMAFLSAWSKAANVDNIRSGFAAAGICPLSMAKPLASRYVNLTIRDGPHTRSSGRMATSDESLAQLATKPSILGERNLPLDKQWAILLYCYDPSGIFVSAPNYFIWKVRGSNELPKFFVAYSRGGYRNPRVAGQPEISMMWEFSNRYFGPCRKLFLFETSSEVTRFCAYLHELYGIGVPSATHQSQHDRLRDVSDFATGRTPLLVGTTSALAGIELMEPALTIYHKMPQDVKKFRLTDGKTLVFYTFGIEVAGLIRIGISTEHIGDRPSPQQAPLPLALDGPGPV